MTRAEIAVRQTVVFKDLVEKTLPQEVWEHVVQCEFFQPGQSYIVTAATEMPEGFCPSGRFAPRDKLAACLRDGDPLTPLIVCFQDGLRPVT